jgi:hypothetical protein
MSEKDEKKSGMNRRDFLRNSAYAAYATPIVLSMLVNKANAAKSWNSGCGEITHTGRPPKNAPVGPHPGRWRTDHNPQ